MRTPLVAPIAGCLVLFLAACGPVPPPPPPGELAASTKQRITAAPPATDIEAVVAGNTGFACDVNRELAARGGNVIFSPYSITSALAMTYAGAKGTTATAFESTLHMKVPADRFHRAMNFLDREISSRGQGAKGKDGKPFRLTPVNQVFAQTGFPLLPAFLDVLAQEYGAGVRLLDFQADPLTATNLINNWVSNVTGGLIPKLLSPLSPDARLVLVNALYFNAAWEKKFEKKDTVPADFLLLDGSKKPGVQLMSGEDLPGAAANVGGTDVVELPHDGGEVSMVVLAPPAGTFADFEDNLTASELDRHLAALTTGHINVQLPKFDFQTKASLKDALTDLGLGVAFTPQADFTGMNTDAGLAVLDVVHQAVVKNDENGTEAAAATASVVGITSVPQFIRIDRPFIFLIRDVQTHAIIFMGRVVDP